MTETCLVWRQDELIMEHFGNFDASDLYHIITTHFPPRYKHAGAVSLQGCGRKDNHEAFLPQRFCSISTTNSGRAPSKKINSRRVSVNRRKIKMEWIKEVCRMSCEVLFTENRKQQEDIQTSHKRRKLILALF